MFNASSVRGYLIELTVVFIGVALAFAVENLREDLNERSRGDAYLDGFRVDLQADLAMLDAEIAGRKEQYELAARVLEFYAGRPMEPQVFFQAYNKAIFARYTRPSRNTMDEVLNSGSLHLIRDQEIRTGLLNLYAHYQVIADTEAHMARDFDVYLYDETFSTVPLQFQGPWEDNETNREVARTLLKNVTIENGFRLILVNLDNAGGGLIELLEQARERVEQLLSDIQPSQ